MLSELINLMKNIWLQFGITSSFFSTFHALHFQLVDHFLLLLLLFLLLLFATFLLLKRITDYFLDIHYTAQL